MKRNVGRFDRIFRFGLGIFLLWLGLFALNGKEGNLVGVFVSLISIMPFYMSYTAYCFVFRWFNIHSLSKKEIKTFGNPKKSNIRLPL